MDDPTDLSLTSVPHDVFLYRDRYEKSHRDGHPLSTREFIELASRDKLSTESLLSLAREMLHISIHFGGERGGIQVCEELVIALPRLKQDIEDAWKDIRDADPKWIGDYEVINKIGGGGQATVYKVIHKHKKHPVALKLYTGIPLPLKSFSDAPRGEATALRKVCHPHIIQFYSLHEDEKRGEIGLVLEYVDGKRMSNDISVTPVPIEKILRILHQVCHAVRKLHRHHVCHRDIKPSNILIESGTLKSILIDFGIAHIQSSDETINFVSRHKGTRAFMAPEVARAAGAISDSKPADIFGIGALCYWFFGGQGPFEATDIPTQIELAKNCTIKWDPIDCDKVPLPIQKLCHEAMAKDAIARPSADDLLTEIESCASKLKIDLSPIADSRPRQGISRSQQVLLTMVLVAIVIAALFLTREQPAKQAPSMPGEGSLTQLALDRHVDLAAVDRSKFEVGVECDDSQIAPYARNRPVGSTVGKALVKFPSDLIDFSKGLRIRIGNRPWKHLRGDPDEGVKHLLLTKEDLRLNGQVQLRIVDDSVSPLIEVAGPFTYDLLVGDEVRRDRQGKLKHLVEEACGMDCMEFLSGNWFLHNQFVVKHSRVVEAIHLGQSENSLTETIRYDNNVYSLPRLGQPGKTYPASTQQHLAKIDEEIRKVEELWVRVDFVDGTKHGPFMYRATNQFGHDGTAGNANKILDDLSPNVPVGLLKDGKFILVGLARVSESLVALEVGQAKDDLSWKVPVNRDRSTDAFYSSKNDAMEVNAVSRPERRLKEETSLGECIITDGVMLHPIRIPPHWRDVYYRGLFAEGSSTGIYHCRNDKTETGFTLELLEGAQGLAPQLHASLPQSALPNPNNKSGYEAWPQFNLTPITLSSVNHVAYVFNGNEWLRPPALRPGVITVRLYDNTHEPIGDCVYSVKEKPFMSAVEAFVRPHVDEFKHHLIQRFAIDRRRLPLLMQAKRPHLPSEKYTFYRPITQTLLDPDYGIHSSVLVGVSGGGFWSVIKGVRWRFIGDTAWQEQLISWSLPNSIWDSVMYRDIAPVFTLPLPPGSGPVEAAIILKDGTSTGVFEVDVHEFF